MFNFFERGRQGRVAHRGIARPVPDEISVMVQAADNQVSDKPIFLNRLSISTKISMVDREFVV